MTLYQTEQGVLALRLNQPTDDNFGKMLTEKGAVLRTHMRINDTDAILQDLQDFFSTGRPLSYHCLDPGLIATEFNLKVLFWTWLVPFGQRVSYGEVARWIGKPAAARAVGQALQRNPLPIFIPCHRVVGADGSMTGFGGGLALKAELLKLEQCFLDSQ